MRPEWFVLTLVGRATGPPKGTLYLLRKAEWWSAVHEAHGRGADVAAAEPLAQAGVGAGGERLALAPVVQRCADDEHPALRRRRPGVELPEHADAVEHGHAQVED